MKAIAWNDPLATPLALTLALGAGLLLARLPLLDGVLLVGLVVTGTAIVAEPVVGLAVALFLGPLRAYLHRGVPQAPAQIGHVFVVLALGVWLARGLACRRSLVRRSPLLLPLLIFLGAASLSLWDAVELAVYGVPEMVKWVQVVLLYLFVSENLGAGIETCPACVAGRPTGVETRVYRRLFWLLGGLLLTGLFQAGVGIWQFGLSGEGPEPFAIMEGRFYRAFGTFEQPNPYGGYLGMTLALAIGVVIGLLADRGSRRHGDRERRRCIFFPCLLVLFPALVAMGIALVMSWSRGAWLGFGSAVTVMAIALPRRVRWGLLLIGVLVVGGVGLRSAGLLPPSVTARLTDFVQDLRFQDVRGVGINDQNYAVVERLAHWQVALEMFRCNLWTGVGFGDYEPAYAEFALINWPIPLGHAHNYYLNVAAEAGLIGLAAYLLLWGAVFWHTWRVTRRAQGFLRGIGIGLLGAWTHLSVHNLLDSLYVNNVHLHIGVMLGILAFIVEQTQKPANRPPDQSTNRLPDQSTTRPPDQVTTRPIDYL